MFKDLASDNETYGALLPKLLERLLQPGGMNVVSNSLELNQPFRQFVDAGAVTGQIAQEGHDVDGDGGGFLGNRDHLLHLVLKLLQVAKVDGAGCRLHLVDGVVHRSNQASDGTTVERCQEGSADAAQDVANYIVRFVFPLFDKKQVFLSGGIVLG